ncbi:MAG: hypothetical protein Q7J70_04485, partial [Thermodesulfovibrionales bacterium]|nr:hypothetical protein [Thermodesulfovibrionales bacterium]
MTEEIKYKQATENEFTRHLESKKMDLEAGWLGKFFGSKSTAATNITGIFLILLLVSGFAVLFFNSSIQAGEYWKIIVPLMTLALGYLFG